MGILGEKRAERPQDHTFAPWFKRVFLVNKRTLFFSGELVIWMVHIGRARHPGPGERYFTPGQLSVEFFQRRWVVDLWGFSCGFLCSVPGCS